MPEAKICFCWRAGVLEVLYHHLWTSRTAAQPIDDTNRLLVLLYRLIPQKLRSNKPHISKINLSKQCKPLLQYIMYNFCLNSGAAPFGGHSLHGLQRLRCFVDQISWNRAQMRRSSLQKVSGCVINGVHHLFQRNSEIATHSGIYQDHEGSSDAALKFRK